jgi:hypothetical protein
MNLWQDQYIRFPSSPQLITRWRLQRTNQINKKIKSPADAARILSRATNFMENPKKWWIDIEATYHLCFEKKI